MVHILHLNDINLSTHVSQAIFVRFPEENPVYIYFGIYNILVFILFNYHSYLLEINYH
jgi:hypothetical protein